MKNITKKIIVVILSALIIISSYQPVISNASIIHISTDDTKDVSGKYKDVISGKTLNYVAQYSDKFFTKKSTDENITFARLSAYASASAYNLSYAKDLLKACGFSATTKKLKTTTKKNDRVSYAIGHKKVGKEYYVAVIIRGENKYEWISDFNIGAGKTHSGYKKAEKELNKNVNAYLKKKKIKGTIKFWVTGHSRGGAIANLYAKRLSKKYKKKNVYAFTFGAQRVSRSVKANTYLNIHNYVLGGDFVSGIVPAKWGFARYGQSHAIGDEQLSKLNQNFIKITGYKYQGLTSYGWNNINNYYLTYVGNNQTTYNKKKKYVDNFSQAPSKSMKKGFAYYLAGKTTNADKNLNSVCNYDRAINNLLGATLQQYSTGIDWNVNIIHSHCPSAYIAYLYDGKSSTKPTETTTEDDDKEKPDDKKPEDKTEEPKKPTPTEKPTPTKPQNNNTTKTKLKEGETVKSSDKDAEYKVTTVDNKGKYVEVSYKASSKKSTKVVIPNQVILEDGTVGKVTSIESGAFKENKTIKRVVIGKNIKKIGNKAFYKCTNLSVVSFLGTDTTTIGDKAFYGCSRLGKFVITKNVKKIGKQAFYKCKKLKKVSVASTKLTKIGKNAFKKTYKKINFNISIDLSKTKMKKAKTLIMKAGAPKKATYAIYL